jgi:hypothetical protein
MKDKIACLTVLRDELEFMITCENRRIYECRILEVWADRGECGIDSTRLFGWLGFGT